MEKLEDIDVMEGIDFKANQKRVRKEQKKSQIIQMIQFSILVITLILLVICINYIF